MIITTYGEIDISSWADWADAALIDQAAAGAQSRVLLEDAVVREAVALNIITPFRQRIASLENTLVEHTAELIYLREHGAKGAIWAANESKDVWRQKAVEFLKS